MSVINSVLKELENKPSSFVPLDLSVAVAEKPKDNSPRVFWFIVSLVVLVLGVLTYQTYRNRTELMVPQSRDIAQEARVEQPAAVSTLPAAVQPGQQAPASPEDDPSPANAIQGLQINETPAYLELAFQLKHQARSYLQSRTRNRYVFFLNGVESSIAAPALDENPWLKLIQISSEDQGVAIRFDTRTDVLVETLSQHHSEGFNWLIRLKKPVPPAANSGTTNPAPSASTDAGPLVEVVNAPQTDVVETTGTTNETTNENNPVKLNIHPTPTARSDVQLLQDGLRLIKTAQLPKARAILDSLLDGEQDRQARLHLVAVLQQQEQFAERDALISEGYKRYPADGEFLLLEAGRLFDRNAYAALIERFGGLQHDAKLLNLLAASYQRLDQHELAIAMYQKALRLDARQPRLWISLAISQQHQQQPEQALKSYQMALRSGLANEKLQAFVVQRIRQLSN